MLISKFYTYSKSFYKFSASSYDEGTLGLVKTALGGGKTTYTVITVVKSPFIYSKAKEQFTRTYNCKHVFYFKLSRVLTSILLSKNIILSLLKSNKTFVRGRVLDIRRF